MEVYEMPPYLTTPEDIELFFDMSDEQQAIMRGADNLLDGLRAVVRATIA
jgi:hypothetical protein